MDKVKVAVIGPGNIGTDLMMKILRSKNMEMALMCGIVESPGIERARNMGIPVTIEGAEGLVKLKDKLGIQMALEATTASAHMKNAPLLREAGIIAIDLTPAAVGPYCVPVVNLEQVKNEMNVNMVTCGGQATIPIVHAIERVAGAKYGEIIATIASKSAGPGTRANIDEFTETTAEAIKVVGGADRSKAVIILNPAEPPIMMSNTIYVQVKHPEVGIEAITKSVEQMVSEIQHYVPGYVMVVPPIMDGDKVTVRIQVTGAGDWLPVYAGNLDMINSAAIRTGELIAQAILEGRR